MRLVQPDHLSCRSRSSILKLQGWIDGGARGNPGPAGWGVRLVRDDGEELHLRGFLGSATNNVAEYSALVEALGAAVDEGATELTVFSDSQLLVRQMSGEYRVKHPNLIPLFRKARSIAAKIPKVRIEHVRREQNKEADRLANEAMDRRVAREIERIKVG